MRARTRWKTFSLPPLLGRSLWGSAPRHTMSPSVAVHGGACAVASVSCGKLAAARSCWRDQCMPLSERSAGRCGLTAWSHVSVGVGATKGLLRGPEYRGQPASEGSLFPQRKIHDFVPEEMSHLHSEARGVWKQRGEYKDKM